MQIDRARFLKLVAALAPAACGASRNDPAPPVVVPVDVQPTPPAKSAAPVAVTPPLETAPPQPDKPAALGIWGPQFDPTGAARSCAQLRCAGPTQEAFAALKHDCKQLELALRPEPFQRFMACLVAHGPKETCDLTLFNTEADGCLEHWADPPAIDPQTEAKCKPLVAACAGANRSVHASGAITMTQCQGLMSIVAPRGERKMIHCITEYCNEAPGLCYMGI